MKTADITGELQKPIAAGQRRALFAAAERLGWSLDDLRAVTPGGSISKLTVRQASELLDRLNAGTPAAERHATRRSPRRPKNVLAMPTPAQRVKLDALREALGWTAERLNEWLSERHYSHGGPMSQMATSRDAREVIELLKDVVRRSKKAGDRRGREGAGSGEAAAGGANGGSTNELQTTIENGP